jgi:hypothetical protein
LLDSHFEDLPGGDRAAHHGISQTLLKRDTVDVWIKRGTPEIAIEKLETEWIRVKCSQWNVADLPFTRRDAGA